MSCVNLSESVNKSDERNIYDDEQSLDPHVFVSVIFAVGKVTARWGVRHKGEICVRYNTKLTCSEYHQQSSVSYPPCFFLFCRTPITLFGFLYYNF